MWKDLHMLRGQAAKRSQNGGKYNPEGNLRTAVWG